MLRNLRGYGSKCSHHTIRAGCFSISKSCLSNSSKVSQENKAGLNTSNRHPNTEVQPELQRQKGPVPPRSPPAFHHRSSSAEQEERPQRKPSPRSAVLSWRLTSKQGREAAHQEGRCNVTHVPTEQGPLLAPPPVSKSSSPLQEQALSWFWRPDLSQGNSGPEGTSGGFQSKLLAPSWVSQKPVPGWGFPQSDLKDPQARRPLWERTVTASSYRPDPLLFPPTAAVSCVPTTHCCEVRRGKKPAPRAAPSSRSLHPTPGGSSREGRGWGLGPSSGGTVLLGPEVCWKGTPVATAAEIHPFAEAVYEIKTS